MASWVDVQAEVPQGSIRRHLFFIIYVNDLLDNLTSSPKLFTDDTSLFSTVFGPNAKANQINKMIYTTLISGLTTSKRILVLILVNKRRRPNLFVS